VHCNAAGDPEEDHLEDPEPCSCDEALGLQARVEELEDKLQREQCANVAAESALASARTMVELCEPYTRGFPTVSFAVKNWLASHPAPAASVRVHTWCPKCDLKHVDALDEKTGIDWATRPHKTHLCLGCGHLWKPHDYATVGVADPAPAAMCRADTGGVPCGEQEPCAEHPEPWRVGTRIPEHVYIGDRPLVTMPTAELAALVVTAVNGEAVTALRACQQKMAEALEELNETRWGFGGSVDSMNSWGETIEGRTFKRVSRAREILGGEGGGT
jgi:hypothetical protein